VTTAGVNYRLRLEWQQAVTDNWFSIEYWLFYVKDAASSYELLAEGYINGDDGSIM